MSDRRYGDTETIITRTAATPETLGFDEDEEFETFIEGLQDRASSHVERYCDRSFALVANATDRLEGNGAGVISTNGDPVVEVHSVRIGSRDLDEGDDYELVDDDLGLEENTGRLRRLRGGRLGGRWRRNAEVVVEYDYGYDDESRPQVVDSVVEDMVVSVLNEAEAERKAGGVQSESMDGYSVTWDLTDAAERMQLTESMERKLDNTVAVQGAA